MRDLLNNDAFASNAAPATGGSMLARFPQGGRFRGLLPRLLCSLLLLGLIPPASLQAQTARLGKIKDWKIFDFFQDPATAQGGTNRLKTLLTGALAEPREGSIVDVTQMWLGSFDQDGHTNLVATAPQCLVDTADRIAMSPGPLQIQTARGQLEIQGTGFNCRLTNIVLVISNAVVTTIDRNLIQSSGTAANQVARPESDSDGPPSPGLATNPPVRIFSDHFLFHQLSNKVFYSGHVRILDPQLNLTCHQLIIHLSTNGSIQEIVAHQNVVLEDQTGTNRAYGDQATYQLTDTSESVELTGTPARWTDGSREGHGTRFLFDPRRHTLAALEQSSVRLPRTDFLLPELQRAQAEGGTNQPAPSTNQFLEITALTMNLRLPTTNQPGRTMLASNQVVITNPDDQSQTTGERAAYDDQTGILELTGSARWESKERLLAADAFYYDRSNQVFRAQSNAFLKLPVVSLGKNSAFSPRLDASTNLDRALDQFLEISSDQLHSRPGQLDFQGNVRGLLRQQTNLLGRLFCGSLTLHMTNDVVERIVAHEQVILEQPPTFNTASNRVEKRLTSQWFTALLHTNGEIRQLVAQTNVLIRQTEYPANQPLPAQTDLRAGTVTAWFASPTNEIERLVAEENVVIEQTAGRARGDRAVYNRAEDTLILSGEVTLETATGLLNAPAAVLKHFGLWPGRLGQLGVPLRSPRNPAPAPANAPATLP